MIAMASTPSVELPRRWHWLMRGFRRFVHRYLHKYFHGIRISNTSHALPPGDDPILVVLNHPSWWDPLVGVALTERFGGAREHFAAIDAAAIERYSVFKRLGFVGVDRTSLRGAAEFLRVGKAILSLPNHVLWVTAQGQFTDARQRPLRLKSGVGRLASRMERGYVLPLALEYAFWNERTPEALTRFGEPINVQDHLGLDGRQWLELIEEALEQNLDCLSAETITRDPSRFTTLLEGRTGIGGVYDLGRRMKAWLRGRRFHPSHEAMMRPNKDG